MAGARVITGVRTASMKVPPKRKGNCEGEGADGAFNLGRLNESPSEKEGKSENQVHRRRVLKSLNESPSEKEGK